MRFQFLISLLLAFAIAVAGQQWWFRGAEPVREPVELTPLSDRDGARLFLSSEQSKRAAAEGLVPEGTRSILNVSRRLGYGDFVWNTNDVGAGPLLVRVNPTSQIISVFRGGHEIGTAVILYGAQGHETPEGRFPIMAKLENHRSSTYDAPMPFTLRLTPDGVAIHGSDVRWGAATHGCIGVPLDFAQSLFREARVGDIVEVFRAT